MKKYLYKIISGIIAIGSIFFATQFKKWQKSGVLTKWVGVPAIILSMLSAFIPSYNASKIDPSELLKLYR